MKVFISAIISVCYYNIDQLYLIISCFYFYKASYFLFFCLFQSWCQICWSTSLQLFYTVYTSLMGPLRRRWEPCWTFPLKGFLLNTHISSVSVWGPTLIKTDYSASPPNWGIMKSLLQYNMMLLHFQEVISVVCIHLLYNDFTVLCL